MKIARHRGFNFHKFRKCCVPITLPRQLTTAMIDDGMRVEQMNTDLAEIDSIMESIEKNP